MSLRSSDAWRMAAHRAEEFATFCKQWPELSAPNALRMFAGALRAIADDLDTKQGTKE